MNLYTEDVVINSRQKIATHYLKEKKSKYEENISVLQTQDTINNNNEVFLKHFLKIIYFNDFLR